MIKFNPPTTGVDDENNNKIVSIYFQSKQHQCGSKKLKRKLCNQGNVVGVKSHKLTRKSLTLSQNNIQQDVTQNSAIVEKEESKCKNEQTKGQKSEDELDKGKKLTRKDFSKDGVTLSKYLLGKIVNRLDKKCLMKARIVETEAYLGITDKACHSYGDKKTNRTQAMFMEEGTSYVYKIYGMYNCLNVSSSDEGGCVLIRALQPIEGVKEMMENRSNKMKNTSQKKTLKLKDVCSGPAKLCQSMSITKDNLNAVDMTFSDVFYMTDDGFVVNDEEIVVCKRIGINGYGEEAANKLYRFYLKGNENVSVRDKNAEG